jgi:hypothetical protein
MKDDGVERRAAFDFKNSCHGCRVARIRAEAVDGFGGERNETSIANDQCSFFNSAPT